MLSSKDVALVYETLLSSPGMSAAVKISVSIPRKNVLLLSLLIERGLLMKEENGQSGLLTMADNNTLEALRGVASELLHKAGLTEMKDKLEALHSK